MTVQATFAATLVDEWVRAGLTDAVVAPGSRSTPLALALAAARELRLHVHLDERSAGFFALGLGLATGRPAIVLTTSGTAAAELHAAVIEAHQGRVPLLVCTADRPSELHHVGAPQTIDQDRLYGSALRWSCAPGVADGLPSASWRSLAARAVVETLANPAGPGPVHLNLAFRDPLVGTPGALPTGRPGGRPWHTLVGGAARAAVKVDPEWVASRRGVIVAGAGCGDPSAVIELADALRWPILADPRSGLRGRGGGVVAAFDSIVRASPVGPEVVVRLGATPASKILAAWLAASGAEQIVVDPFGTWADPERLAHTFVAAHPGEVCRALVSAAEPAKLAKPAEPAWLDWWQRAERAAQSAIDAVLDDHPEPTEPGIVRSITSALGEGATIFVSSSMPVRDLEWFGHPGCRAQVLANRGANGIDGVVSTALGVAAGVSAGVSAGLARGNGPATGPVPGDGPALCLLGDLAFLHDLGGLVGARRRPVQLCLVVVDNDGGGIFSFLPQAAALAPERFDQLFATPHGLDLVALSTACGAAATVVEKADQIAAAVGDAVRAGGVRVIVVRTERRANVMVHDELNEAVAQAIGAVR